GGWLMLSQPYQDVQFYARFKCDGPCNSGVLLRATKTPAGTTGMFVSLKEGDLNSYKMTLDASGKEISRELMSNVTYGTIRTGGPQTAGGGGGGGGGGAPAGRAGGGAAPPAGGPPGAGGGGRAGGGAGRAAGGGGGGRGGPLFTIAGPFPTPMPDLEPPL